MSVDLPATWERVALAEVMDAILDYRGKSPRKTDRGVPLITAKIVKNGRLGTPSEFIDPAGYDDWMRRGLPQSGDVLITTEAPLGEVAQLKDAHVALAQRLIALRGKAGRVDNTFLKYLMISDDVQRQLRARSSGTTVLGIKQSELRKIELRLPPFPEQVTIASILAAFDEKIELNHSMNRVLENMAREVFAAWFVRFEPVTAKAAGARHFQGMPQDAFDQLPDQLMETSLGPLPAGWDRVPIGNLVQVVGGSTPSTSNPEFWEGGIHPFCTPKDMSGLTSPVLLNTERHLTEAGVNNISSGTLPVRTVLLSSRAPIGYLALAETPVSVNQGIIAMFSSVIPSTYVLLWAEANMGTIEARAGGSTFAEISKSNFRQIQALRPSMSSLDAFGSVTEPLFEKIASNERESALLSLIRDAMLPRLVSGEIRVPESKGVSDGD